jgi:uncharacterized integral membrane protein (TIGR00698 family)
MAVEPVVRARAEHVTVAIATVVAFGTISIFLYPALFLLNEQWQIVPGGESVFGIYIGSTVHEVAQVVAAARSVGAHAADTAVIEKMVRVVMLAPFLIALSAWLTRASSRGEDRTCNNGGGRPGREAPITIPWFAFGFLAVVLLNSLHSLPTPIEGLSLEFDNFILAMAMAALGLSTHVNSLRQAGVRPLLLALLLYVWLLAGGAAINCWVPKLISII